MDTNADALLAACTDYLARTARTPFGRCSLTSAQNRTLKLGQLRSILLAAADSFASPATFLTSELYVLAKLKTKFSTPFRKQK